MCRRAGRRQCGEFGSSRNLGVFSQRSSCSRCPSWRANCMARFDLLEKGKKWEKDVGLSEELLILLFQRRDAVKAIRSPLKSHSLVTCDNDGNPIVDKNMQEHQGFSREYERLFERLATIKSEIYPLVIRSSVVWKDDVKKHFTDMDNLEADLTWAVNEMLAERHPNAKMNGVTYSREELKERGSVLFATGKTNEFTTRYDTVFDAIELCLRSKLNLVR